MPISTLKPNHRKSNSYILHVIHLPIIALLLGILVVSGYFSNRIASNLINSDDGKTVVLGDDDKDDDDNSSSGKDDDDKDDDDNSGSGKDNDDVDDDDKDDDDNSGSGKDDDDDDEEDEVDSFNSGKGSGIESKMDEDEDEVKTLDRVQNDDGTFTVTQREEDDEETEVKIITYDANGNKIMVEEFKSKDGEEKSRVKVYDEFGNKLSDYRLETEDGKKLELRLKEGETELSRVKFDIEKQELVIRSGDDDTLETEESAFSDRAKLKVRLSENNFIISRNGIDVLSKFPLTVDDTTGDILVETPSGEIKLGAMPDTIVEKAESSDDIDVTESLELEAEDNLEYKLFGTKTEKLLGVFTIQIPSTLIYDAETGSFLRTEEQPSVTRVLDLFSF